jgi:2-keto-4-pentenoate hydratase
MKQSFEQLAQALAAAWRSCGTIALPPAAAAPASREDAFAIQDRMAELIGERCVGWKVGAAVRAVQVLEGHDGPITGRLLASRLFDSPGRIPAAFDGYKIESEFAFRFRDAVPPRERAWTRAELAPQLVFHPGLEVAGTRFAAGTGGRKATTHDAIADNGTGGAYVVGAGIADWQGIDFEHLPVDARIDGGDAIHTYTGEFRRDPVDILVETVNGLSARGIGLAAGDLLSTGSLTLPTLLPPGQTYIARFGDLMTVSVAMDLS